MTFAWASIAAFGTYFCMYAFRKPFSVALYEGLVVGDWEYKTVAVTSQVCGYMLSKFIGIKVLSEMPPGRRAAAVIALIMSAEVALVLLAIVPTPWNVICLFLNGLPLGMVFGLVLSFLEGRRGTEAMAAILCTSFIVSDGVVKSTGQFLIDQGVPQFWMPASVGGIFLAPLLGFVWMLTRVPRPNTQDEISRQKREPLNRQQRWDFIRRNATGLIPILIMFLMVTIVRSIRSDFAADIWASMGVARKPQIFTYSEIWVGLAVTIANGAAVLIVSNYRAFQVALAICVGGLAILLGATVLRHNGSLAPFTFMVAIGIGLYLPYVAVHTTIFERMIAMTRDRSNLVFLMYLADSIGYLGYVAVMLAKNAGAAREDFMAFFIPVCYVAAIASLACVLISCFYYHGRRSDFASD
ncbi:MAG TPA: hypothetical protein DDW52_18240 [Planctomycetaceae bacterium]|nr:hypothetical protein [Planctomycetaceae bacterium]